MTEITTQFQKVAYSWSVPELALKLEIPLSVGNHMMAWFVNDSKKTAVSHLDKLLENYLHAMRWEIENSLSLSSRDVRIIVRMTV